MRFLSEPGRIRTFDRLLRREVLYPAELRAHSHGYSFGEPVEWRRVYILKLRVTSKATRISSGWQDSNLRPPRPKRGAMTGLRYTPKFFFFSVLRRDGDSNPGYPIRVRLFSKQVLSATQAPLLFNELPLLRSANIVCYFQ